jgi:sec-independent protein translocase protein TatB
MEIGWTELMVIGVVALIVIGPKDLPEMFRTLGRFTAKARSMAREFSRAMENAARETGVHEVAKDLKSVSSPKSMGLEAVKTAADKFEKWDPLKNAAKPTSPMPVRTAPPAPPPMPPVAQAAVTDLSDVLPTTPAAAAAAASAGAASAGAAVAASEGAATVASSSAMGPATAALAEKQAKRKAIAAEAAAKLRAVSEEPAAAAVVEEKPKAARKPRAKKAEGGEA